jgi:DNA-binding winged helix-turn-helix (wHTH) protein
MNATNVVAHSAGRAVSHANSAPRATANPVRVRFDAFELDEANALLLRAGQAIALAPRPFGLLCALARQPRSLISKNTLLDDVWGHQFYSDSVLKTAVSEVRTVLDDDPRAPRFIETVSRRGYRFIGATTAIAEAAPIPGIDFSGRPWIDGRTRHQASVDASDCWLYPRPVYATTEEVRYAEELKLRLRATYLGARSKEPS